MGAPQVGRGCGLIPEPKPPENDAAPLGGGARSNDQNCESHSTQTSDSERGAIIGTWHLLKLIGTTDLRPNAKHLLCACAGYFGKHTLEMRTSIQRLAWEMGRDIRTVQRALTELVASEILVALTPRRGGRLACTGPGITTRWRLDLERLRARARPETIRNPGSVPGYDDSDPGSDAGEGWQDCAATPAAVRDSPGTMPDKQPSNNHLDNQKTTTSSGGGGGVASLSEEIRAEAVAENERLLREFGATNRQRIRAAAINHPPDVVRSLIAHARAKAMGAGLVLQMLAGEYEVPAEVLAHARRQREHRERQAAALQALRARLAAIPQDRLNAARARAPTWASREDRPELERLEVIVEALQAIEREEAEAADVQRFRALWDSLAPEELTAIRNRLQVHSVAEIARKGETSALTRARVYQLVADTRAAVGAQGASPR